MSEEVSQLFTFVAVKILNCLKETKNARKETFVALGIDIVSAQQRYNTIQTGKKCMKQARNIKAFCLK